MTLSLQTRVIICNANCFTTLDHWRCNSWNSSAEKLQRQSRVKTNLLLFRPRNEKWLKTSQPVAMSFRLRSSYFSKKDIFQQLSEGWIWGSTIDTICNRVGASQIIYINNDKKIGCTRPRLSADRIRSRNQLISRLFFPSLTRPIGGSWAWLY